MPIEHEDWSDGSPANETPAPTFTVEDLELLKLEADRLAQESEDGDDIADSPFDLDAYRNSYEKGLVSEDYLAKLNLNAREMAYVTGSDPAASDETTQPRKSVDAELAEIKALRKSDPTKYWSEPVQKRQLELLDAQEQRAAQREKASRESPTADQLRAIEDELRQIAKTRREDRRTYWRDEKLQARERELLERKEELETEHQASEQIDATVMPILEGAGDPEAFEADFDAVFNTLSEATQDAIRQEIQSVPLNLGRPASQANVEEFASSDVGADLIEEWGRQAPYKVGMLKARLGRMLTGASDRQAAEAWLDSLPVEEAKAVLRTLAR